MQEAVALCPRYKQALLVPTLEDLKGSVTCMCEGRPYVKFTTLEELEELHESLYVTTYFGRILDAVFRGWKVLTTTHIFLLHSAPKRVKPNYPLYPTRQLSLDLEPSPQASQSFSNLGGTARRRHSKQRFSP